MLSLFRKKPKGKVTVVGLDGVPFSFLSRMVAEGVMPQVSRISEKGRSLRRMNVVFPEISAVSWPSFMTGVDPGTHGVYGFTDLVPGSYAVRFPQFGDVASPTLWDKLSERGKVSVVINQPSTYPARKLNGALISGFVAVDLLKAVYPTKYLGALKRMNYAVDLDTSRARKDADFLFRELERILTIREEVSNSLRSQENWDYFEIVITGTDRLQHYQMHAIMDPKEPNHERAMEYYRKVDGFIGRLYERHLAETKDEGANFLMLSDHGFTLIEQEVNITSWLVENGYLRFEGEGRSLDDIAVDSKAFALDPGRIYLNLKNRYPKGSVNPADAEELKNELCQKLAQLSFDDKTVLRRIFRPEEIFHGPHCERAPDLLAWAHDGFDLKASLDHGPVFRRTDLTGMHTQHDAFLHAPGADFSNGVAITDLFENILSRY